MRKLVLIIALMIPMSIFAQQLNVMSFNIRYNNPADGINAWPNRIEMVTGLLNFHEPDLFGLQEALEGQIKDIHKQLPNFEWFGVGREDGKKGGEFAPIFYNSQKFILVESGHFWLAETPDKPVKGWDAACTRIVTWGKFQSKISGKRFFFFNTHFDHVGDEARNNAATLIQEKIKEFSHGKNLPVILSGDFNLTPKTEPIARIKKYMKDSRDVTLAPPYGPVGTFHAFKPGQEKDHRIDYIFVKGGIKVLKYAALSETFENRPPSDHLPVFVKLQLLP